MEKDIDILIEGLSARVKYGVRGVCTFECDGGDYDYEGFRTMANTEIEVELYRVDSDGGILVFTPSDDDNLDRADFVREYQECAEPLSVEEFKPFLRPLSSMTEEEEDQWRGSWIDDLLSLMDAKVQEEVNDALARSHSKSVKWLLQHNFDINGLIPLGLAKELKTNTD